MYRLFSFPTDDGQCPHIEDFDSIVAFKKWWPFHAQQADGPQHFLTDPQRKVTAVEHPTRGEMIWLQ